MSRGGIGHSEPELLPVLCVDIDPWRIQSYQHLDVFANMKNTANDYYTSFRHSMNVDQSSQYNKALNDLERLNRNKDDMRTHPAQYKQMVDGLRNDLDVLSLMQKQPRSVPSQRQPMQPMQQQGTWPQQQNGPQAVYGPPPQGAWSQQPNPQAAYHTQQPQGAWTQHPPPPMPQAPQQQTYPRPPNARGAWMRPAPAEPSTMYAPPPPQGRPLMRATSLLPARSPLQRAQSMSRS